MLKLINIKKHYQNNWILKDINLTLPDQGLFTIVGKSGCGKSTLLNIIGLIDDDFEGQLIFNNVTYQHRSEQRQLLIQNIGIIYQDFNLINNLTVFENVKLSALLQGNESKEEIEIALKKVNLKESLWKMKVNVLSGGERQRVAIARAIINHPKILIADEPTGSLDSKNGKEIMQLLKNISDDCLIIMVSHNLSLAKKYSTAIIEFSNLKNNLEFCSDKKLTYCYMKRKDKTMFLIIKSHLLGNKIRYFIISLALMIPFIFSNLSLSFVMSCQNFKQVLTGNFADRNVLKVSKSKNTQIDDSIFTLTQLIRPTIAEMQALQKIFPPFKFYYDLGGLLSEVVDIRSENESIKNVQFLPVFSESKLGFGEVIVNTQFYNELKSKDFDKQFDIVIASNVTISFTINFHICKIVDEVSLLNNSKIYYDYLSMKQFLSNKLVQIFDKTKSLYELIVEADATSQLSNFAMFIVLQNLADANKAFDIIDKGISNYDINSNAYMMNSMVGQLIESIEFFLILFEVILLISSIAILIFVITSLIYDHRKEKAILLSMGKTEKQALLTYCVEVALMNFAAIILSLVIQLPFVRLFNNLIFTNNNIKLNLKFLPSFAFCSLVFFIIGFSVVFFVFYQSKKEKLVGMLRED